MLLCIPGINPGVTPVNGGLFPLGREVLFSGKWESRPEARQKQLQVGPSTGFELGAGDHVAWVKSSHGWNVHIMKEAALEFAARSIISEESVCGPGAQGNDYRGGQKPDFIL